MILYMMFRSFKWAALILVNVLVGTVGGFVARLITNTNFSVSSGVGMPALFGVPGFPIEDAAIEGAVLRLRRAALSRRWG
jgi:cobalt-zinc-cadmium resistance protein CzcA